MKLANLISAVYNMPVLLDVHKLNGKTFSDSVYMTSYNKFT